MFARIASAALILAMLCAVVPAPVLAMSTSTEVQLGKQQDDSIVQSSTIETDPLLNAWVASVSNRLFAQTARKDVPYNVKIIKANDVNAFSTYGGYIYVNSGTLDFAQSDDELAGVLGHETGHIERRHNVTMQAKAQAINLLFGIASLFSPFLYRFGQIAEAGIMSKMSRVDELQADQYGLLLMSRAGFDPQAMVTFMRHLGTLQDEHSDLVTKYLEDHPDPKARVGHLLGYPELDPTKVTEQQRLVAAVHDEETARYNIAAENLNSILKTDPNNSEALLTLGKAQLALGQNDKSEQTLTEAAQKGTPQTRSVALERISALRQIETRNADLLRPNLNALKTVLDQAQETQTQAIGQIGSRRDEGTAQIKSLQARLQAVSYEIPDFSRIQVRNGSKIDAVLKNINGMARSIDSALSDSSNAIGGVGSMEKNKEGGLLKENALILKEMNAPLKSSPMPTDSIAVFPQYPRMVTQLQQADGEMVRGVDAGRASLSLLDNGLGDLDEFLKRLDQMRVNGFGDFNQFDYEALVPLMQKADDSMSKAAIAASQADQLYNLARSNQEAARITLLGVGTSPQRYQTFQYALNQRLATSGPSYSQMLHDDLSPGEIAEASIIAADTKSTPQAIIDQAKSSHRTLTEVANSRGMHAIALEIFLGLVYLDYTDDPVKELQGAE
ncbi:MAG: M48 family metalloprotease [Candidatus Eremiobacteraeota bacterium]|nr:M48 family metalloprotease [Candidatus Eremiobacteraeota bacterium]